MKKILKNSSIITLLLVIIFFNSSCSKDASLQPNYAPDAINYKKVTTYTVNGNKDSEYILKSGDICEIVGFDSFFDLEEGPYYSYDKTSDNTATLTIEYIESSKLWSSLYDRWIYYYIYTRTYTYSLTFESKNNGVYELVVRYQDYDNVQHEYDDDDSYNFIGSFTLQESN